MKYLDNKEINNLKQYFFNLENIEYESMNIINKNNNTNDEKEFNTKKITTKISIDFFAETVKIFLVIPKKERKKEETEETEIFQDDESSRTRLILEKQFTIAEDYETILIDGKRYLIPKYFNAEHVKSQDEKTWQIIFYQIFNKEISEALFISDRI